MTGVLLERRGDVAVVTIDRPQKKNSMTDSMWAEFPDLISQIAADDSLLVTVIHGAGTSFCSGSDITGLAERKEATVSNRALEAIASCPKPVIAAIEGNCHGGGWGIALAADVRVAGKSACFSIPVAKLGLIFPLVATRRMIDLVGPSVTKELVFTAAKFDAGRALALGLINEISQDMGAFDHAMAMATRMASLSQLTLRSSKEIIDALADHSLNAEGFDHQLREALNGPDLAEGIAAFEQRRHPSFSWRG